MQVLKSKGVNVLTINPAGGKKLDPNAVAEELIRALQSAQSSPDSIPEELTA